MHQIIFPGCESCLIFRILWRVLNAVKAHTVVRIEHNLLKDLYTSITGFAWFAAEELPPSHTHTHTHKDTFVAQNALSVVARIADWLVFQ